MFEIGFWELALLFGLGLIVLGPEKLPKVADQLGRYAGQARRMARTFTDQIRDEIAAEERRAANSGSAASQAPVDENVPPFSRPGVNDLIPADTEQASASEDTGSVVTEAAEQTSGSQSS